MIQRLYVHNFRCLENFELDLTGLSSALLIGKNGAGKSTVMAALRVLQKAARGANRVRELVVPSDLTRANSSVPMRFEIEVKIEGSVFVYSLALELPEGFRELRISEERFVVDGHPVFSRRVEKITLTRAEAQKEATFTMDWHHLALPVIQGPTSRDLISKFNTWLGQILLLRPIPSGISGESSVGTLQPSEDLSDLGAWFTGIMAHSPAAYIKVDEYLKSVMTDFDEIQNRMLSTETRSLMLRFKTNAGVLGISFASLSDGEKCFVASALVIAAQASYGPLFCFWDEPDNFLALSEVGHFILNLRKTFKRGGQFLATSHNPETIRRFSEDNTLLIDRRSHLEPPVLRKLSSLEHDGDVVGALLRNELTAWA